MTVNKLTLRFEPKCFKVGFDSGIDYDGRYTYNDACIKAADLRDSGTYFDDYEGLLVIDTRTGRAVSEVIGFDYENG